MKLFSNIEEFFKPYEDNLQITNELEELILFTYQTKVIRDLGNGTDSIITNNEDGSYTLHCAEKEYCFHVFSDFDLQECDKQMLMKKERNDISLFRTLKLACSMDLVEPKVVIGNSCTTLLSILILFKEKEREWVVDYQHNLVMNKEDYYFLFKYQEINVVDKFDINQIYYMLTACDDFEHIYEYLIFTKEIFAELRKKKITEYLSRKYDALRIHVRNAIVLGGPSFDCLFFGDCDISKSKYANIIKESKTFTENPAQFTEHITYNQGKARYRLEEEHFGFFNFDLLSDLILDEEIKKNLLSKEREGQCHMNVHVIARYVKPSDYDHVFIVSGKFKENEKDFLYHSWIENKKKNIVFDYNRSVLVGA